MNIKAFEEKVKASDNFKKISEVLNEFIMDVDNIDYDSYEIELNEVVAANLDNMDIKEIIELEVKGSSFKSVIEVVGNIEIEDHVYEEEISDSVEITFGITVLGSIETDEVVIKNIEKIEKF